MREKSHYARYGNNVMQRVYCSECKCWALVLDHRKQCCDGWYNVESKITRVVVQPKHQRVLLPLYKKQAILNHQNNRCCYCGHQLGGLANDLTKICQLLKWLLPRVKNNSYEDCFNQAAVTFFNSGNKNVFLLGVLIRDTQSNAQDLAVRGSDLRNRFSEPTTCQLTALYLPWQIEELISKIRNGGAS